MQPTTIANELEPNTANLHTFYVQYMTGYSSVVPHNCMWDNVACTHKDFLL